MKRESGDQKGYCPSSLPTIGRASTPSRGRNQSFKTPSAPLAEKVRYFPSGERVSEPAPGPRSWNSAPRGGGRKARIAERGAAGRVEPAIASQAATAAARMAAVQASLSRKRRRDETTAGAARPAADPSEIQRSSLPTSPADCHRSSGSFARHVLTTRSSAGGVIGCSVEIGGGSELMIDEISDAWLVPSNAFLPVAIS